MKRNTLLAALVVSSLAAGIGLQSAESKHWGGNCGRGHGWARRGWPMPPGQWRRQMRARFNNGYPLGYNRLYGLGSAPLNSSYLPYYGTFTPPAGSYGTVYPYVGPHPVLNSLRQAWDNF